MLGQVVRRELDDGWSVVGEFVSSDGTGSVISDEPIAEHETGAKLYVDILDPSVPIWAVSITQPITYKNIRAEPVTISEHIRGKQYAAKFIRDTCNGIADESNRLAVIGFIPHTGELDSVDLSYLETDTDIELDDVANLVDIFCVYPATLPDKIDVDDIRTVRKDMIKMVYGMFDEDNELPETIKTLSSKQEAYGSARLETYTVPTTELEQLS